MREIELEVKDGSTMSVHKMILLPCLLLHANLHAATALQFLKARGVEPFMSPARGIAPRATIITMMPKKSTWSIGHARKKAKGKAREKDAKPQGRGFGAPATPPAPTTKAAASKDENLAPADLNANDLQTAAAEAGGETWRAYANEALAQVAALEAEAEAKAISAAELMARQSALDEAASQRGGSK